MEPILIRSATPQDLSEVTEMCHCLWPEATASEHASEMGAVLAGNAPGTLPTIIFVAQTLNGRLVGFVEAGLRSHADGCDHAHPVGYLEGWYVTPEFRRAQVGRKLIVAAEEWARSLGCTEMASDTWLDALGSQVAHEALGFEVVDRCVHYRKLL